MSDQVIGEPAFARARDGVDPRVVPRLRLADGGTMPAIGMGTFGSDRYRGEDVARAVVEAADLGYRHFDCASVYGNEAQIGGSLRTILAGGIGREELWVTSKLWNDSHGEGQVALACERSLRDLGLDYLDLYLIHWPFPNTHPPGCDMDSRSPNAKPYLHDQYMNTWRQMEELVDRGLTRRIGSSNMTIPKLQLLLRDARIRPACNEMELHPHFQQPELFQYLVSHGITPIGYCPIGSPNRPDRDRSPEDTVDLEDAVIAGIASRLNLHPAVVCLKWAITRGQAPIPFSVKRSQLLENLRAAAGDPLSADDMRAISAIDRGRRLIKGQVFLWKDNQGWEDLWDLNGEITPP